MRKDKQYKAPVPVVAIGNISTGGTGKTPFTEHILRFFISKGLRPAYLSRGYGRSSRGFKLVDPHAHSSAAYGDEALQVARKFPTTTVAVCESRAEGIRLMLASQGVDVIVLDDAFQHRKVQRDVDIVICDANRLPQEDALLPAGRLREPIQSLRRADFIVVNKISSAQLIPELKQKFSTFHKPMAYCTPEFEGIFDFFSSQKMVLEAAKHRLGAVVFSGLGNNRFFQQQVADLGIELLAVFEFRDHYAYRQQDLEQIARTVDHHTKNSHKFDAVLLLTTEKDRTRLLGHEHLSRWEEMAVAYLPIRLSFWEGHETVEAFLHQEITSQLR